MYKLINLLLIPSACFFLSCSTKMNPGDEGITFTLYKNLAIDKNERIHVATFDVNESERYNKNNCHIAAQMWMRKASLTKFWCEKGTFKD